MMGQAGHFALFATEKMYVSLSSPSFLAISDLLHPHSPYAIDRYTSEVKRLFSVLDTRLKDRDYIAGPGRGKYGLADIKTFTWCAFLSFTLVPYADARSSSPRVRNGSRFGFDMNEYPGVKAWIDRIDARPAVQAGLAVPAA